MVRASHYRFVLNITEIEELPEVDSIDAMRGHLGAPLVYKMNNPKHNNQRRQAMKKTQVTLGREASAEISKLEKIMEEG